MHIYICIYNTYTHIHMHICKSEQEEVIFSHEFSSPRVNILLLGGDTPPGGVSHNPTSKIQSTSP
jgi:hypothetical protein